MYILGVDDVQGNFEISNLTKKYEGSMQNLMKCKLAEFLSENDHASSLIEQ